MAEDAAAGETSRKRKDLVYEKGPSWNRWARRMDGWTEGWMDGWMDEWMDGCMDEWIQIDKQIDG